MSQKLQLLVIEGHDADYELLLAALRKAGIEHNTTRINSGQDVVTELRKRLPDLIIAEFGPSPSS
ncbi:MAG TPA: hypothetical protein VI758_05220, partial [Bacteroidota bacterium]